MIPRKSYTLQVSDVSGQRRHTVRGVPVDSSIGELIDGLLPRMNLTPRSSAGEPLTYHALLEREGRHLNRSEKVAESLQHNDQLVIEPEIVAG